MRPTLRTVLLFLAGGPLALLCALIDPALWTMWVSFLVGSTVLFGFDALVGLPRRRMRLRVEAPDTLYIADRDPLKLHVRAPGWKRETRFHVIVDLDEQLATQPEVVSRLVPDGEQVVEVELVPRRRGTVVVERVVLQWRGPLGLTRRQRSFPVNRSIAVVPNVRAVRSAALQFLSRDSLFGAKIDKNRGDGSEFDALRDYTVGMDHRGIDWKHSARHRRLVAKEFRSERNHPVVLAVDTGHLMSVPIQGVAKLDHAINSALLLSFFALRSGDRVSLFAFDSKVRSYSEPRGGLRTFHRLQHQSSEIDYQTEETNFTLGMAELATRLSRRTLIILLTDFTDTITAELMIENVQRLARRHLIVFVTARDPSLEALIWAKPEGIVDMHRAVVAADFIRERELVLQRLRRIGVHCLDSHPGKVSTDLINRYLEIKRRELL